MKLRSFQRNWESFTKEIPQKFASLVASGVSYNFTTSTYRDTIKGTATFSSNMDAARNYLEQIQDNIENKSNEIILHIKEFDKNLQEYVDEGIDSEIFKKLVKHLNEWFAYIPQMEFVLWGQRFTFEVSDEIMPIRKKWEHFSLEELREQKAKKYGVDPANLDKHETYLIAKSQQLAAKTSASMKRAESLFASLHGYLDSDKLAKSCATAALGLKASEDNTARMLKNMEETLKINEERRKLMEEEAYKKQVEEVKKARESFIASEKERLAKNIKNTLAFLQSKYDKESKKNRKAIEAATTEKNKLEQELAEVGLFAFATKKKLRADIQALSERISVLSIECKEMEENLKVEKAKQQNAYESALAAVPANAESRYAMPLVPRHLRN